MIKTVQLRNFLSHKNSKLEFSPGVNVIVGQTYAGKSAIIKGINLVANNRPTGDEFRSHWGGATKVMVNSYGNKVSRIKDNGINEYHINNEKFKAFGSSVPEEVQTALNLSEVNIENQFDTHFLISKTPGEVSQYFNEISNLDRLDLGLKNVKKWIGEINQDVKTGENKKEEIETQLKEYEYLDQLEEKVIYLEKIEKELKEIDDNIDYTDDTINKVEEYNKEIEEKSLILKAEKKLNEVLEKIDKLKKLDEQAVNLNTLLNDIGNVEREITNKSELIPAENIVKNIIELNGKEEKLSNNIEDFENLQTSIDNTKKKITRKEEELNKCEEDFHKNFPDQCPLCDTYKETLHKKVN